MAEIGKNIQRFRTENGYSQRALAELLNVSQVTVSYWESGRNEPSIENMMDMCEVFHCTLSELLGRIDPLMKAAIQAERMQRLNATIYDFDTNQFNELIAFAEFIRFRDGLQ